MNSKIVNRSRSLVKHLGIALLIIVIVSISGCVFPDKTYSLAEEEYAMGWILHNINDSTETTLDYPLDELAVYNYSFNYPSTQPQSYRSYLWWVAPVPKNGGGIAAASGNEISVPLDRIYYVKGENPVPENYRYNWSFSNFMAINYLESNKTDEQFALMGAHEEHYESEYAFEGITPIPGDRRHIYFGTAPFTPASLIIDSNYLRLDDHLMKGYGDKSYLLRETEITIEDLMTGETITMYVAVPTYKIYLNGTLREEGNLTDYSLSKKWDYSRLFYYLSEDGNYLVNITIPTNYPVWNKTIITAQFNKPSSDMNPPVLNHIEVSPRFEANIKTETIELPIIANITDDSGIVNVSICYSTWIENNWVCSPANSNYPIYDASLSIADGLVNEINLKLVAEDNIGNNVTYTILPVSLKSRIVNFNLVPSKTSAKKGEEIWISGSCTDNLGLNCGGLRLKYYLNNDYLKADRTGSYGEFSSNFIIPYDLTSPQANFSVVFEGTGIYSRKEGTTSVDIITYDHDLAIDKLTLSTFMINQTGNVSTTLYNIGHENETDITIEFLINGNVEDSISIAQLNSGDSEKIGFSWTPTQAGKYYISVSVNPIPEEGDIRNNYRESIVTIGPDLSAMILYEWGRKITVNQTTTIRTWTYNIGNEDANNITLRLIDSTENITIDTVNVSTIRVGERKSAEFDWTPSEGGYHEIIFIANVTNDADPSNNEDFSFLRVYGTSDVSVYIDWYWNQRGVVNETNELPISLTNFGIEEARNLTAVLYDMFKYNDYHFIYNKSKTIDFDGVEYNITAYRLDFDPRLEVYKAKLNVRYNEDVEEFSLNLREVVVLKDGTVLELNYVGYDSVWIYLGKADISETNLPDLRVDEQRRDLIDWIPLTLGSHRVYLFVNTSRDDDWRNNYYSRVIDVMPELPDVKNYIYYIRFAIVNRTTNVTVSITNYGARVANDTWAALYDILPNNTEILIGNVTIVSIPVGDSVRIDYPWTPSIVGSHKLKSIIDCTDDWDPKNNEDKKYIDVVPVAPDVTGDIWYPGTSLVDKTVEIPIEVRNMGAQEATNVIASLYDYLPNNTKVNLWNKTIGTLTSIGEWDDYFIDWVEWTPDILGHHTLELVVNCTDDWSNDNNIIDKLVIVYELTSFTFYVTDHLGGFTNVSVYVPRYMYNYYPINISEIITLPDLEKLDIWLIRFENESYFDVAMLWNSKMNKTMRAKFEHYLGKVFEDDIILHSIIAYNTSWDYENVTMMFPIVNYDLHDPDKTSIYVCSEWDWEEEECASDWEYTNATYEWLGYEYDDRIFSNVSSTNAFALAEPQFCGDDYCSPSEDCSSCSEDCGTCPPTTTSTTSTTTSTEITDGTTTVPPLSENDTVEFIEAGQTGNFTYKKLPITDMEVKVKNNVSDVTITVTKKTTIPTSIAASAPGIVYSFLDIEKQNIEDDDIKSVKIKFEVEFSWVDDEEIDEDTIALYRYHDDKWTKLTTSELERDSDYIYFEAESPGLSIFAISGMGIVVTTTTVTTTISTTTVKTTTTTSTTTTTIPEEEAGWVARHWYIIVIIVFVAVIVILIVLRYTRSLEEARTEEEFERLKEKWSR